MSANIVELVSWLSNRRERSASLKVAEGTCGKRLLHVGMTVPRVTGKTVELRILSDDPGKARRNLARVTIQLDDLRRLMKELEDEAPFWAATAT